MPEYLTTHFTREELACRATGKAVFARDFLRELEALRVAYNKPMTVTSCCRSAVHNKAVGGNPRSLHVYDFPHHPTGGTCAIDIHMPDSPDKGDLIAHAWGRGWSVGVAKTFVHLDRRTEILGMPQTLYMYQDKV